VAVLGEAGKIGFWCSFYVGDVVCSCYGCYSWLLVLFLLILVVCCFIV